MRIKRLAAAIALFPLAVAGAGWLYQRAGLKHDARRHPPAGLLLSCRGRYLHVMQQGSGRPAIGFEAGLAASSLSWAKVQPLAASFASTLSYDRAGLGWSSPAGTSAPLSRLDDLRRVVAWAGGRGPVVLVAHSFGALMALQYTQQYPDRVAALVLVDPISLAGWANCSLTDQRRLQIGAALSRRGAWLAEFGLVRAALKLLLSGGQRFAKQIGRRAAGRGAATLERLTGEISKLPRELWPAVVANWSRPESFRTMAETLDSLRNSASEVGDPQLPRDLPVVILSAASATADELRERDGWLAGLLHAEHKVLPETGHWLHLDQPEEVAAAAHWCMERARERNMPPIDVSSPQRTQNEPT